MNVEIEGLDELQDVFGGLKEKIEALDGEHEVPVSELFDASFMKQHTPHSDFVAFLEAGGFEIETQEDFEAIPEGKLDEHVREATEFGGWEEMAGAAVQAWAAEQLDFS